MATFSIKDVELLSGVKAHTLRVWELRYSFLKPHRTETNIRYYTDEQLKLLLNIGLLNRAGLKISKIAKMDEARLHSEVLRVTTESDEPNLLLDSLIQSMLQFDENRFEQTLSKAIIKHGFEQAFSEVIFPMMIRTGVLWSTGTIGPAQEHFISNLVRRKILVAIDSLFVQRTARSKKFVLFLPEGETHELLLLYSEYLLRKNNHEVVYIGASLPMPDLLQICKTFHPQYLFCFLTVPPAEYPLQDYINRLGAANPQLHIVLGGAQIESQKPTLSANMLVVCNMRELLNFVKSL